MGSDFMRDLPDVLHTVPLNRLAIPGSHNSGAFDLFGSDWAPDAPGFLKKIPGFKLIKSYLYNWCTCQKLSIGEQLSAGIRYLDLRVSSRRNDENLYLVHALFGPKVSLVLNEIVQFLDLHPKEVVILDFNHFYEMNKAQHEMLIAQIKAVFGSKLVVGTHMNNLCLNLLWRHKKQVICVYHHDHAVMHDELWPSKRIRSPWFNTPSPEVCLHRMTAEMERIATHDTNQFIVCQGILTPDWKYISSHLTRSREGGVYSLTLAFRPSFLTWLNQTSACGWFPYLPNIVIHDFVEEGDYIQSVADLNLLRLETMTTGEGPETNS